MDATELEKRRVKAATETLVIAPTEGGFRVYNPSSLANLYMVTGIPQEPRCNCPDFEKHQDDPEWRCKHILVVQNRMDKQKSQASTPSEKSSQPANREPGQTSANSTTGRKLRTTRNGQSQMLIKRSVSPNGYIDSLSVELSTPIEPGTDEAIKLKARQVLSLQTEIIDAFLKTNVNRKNGVPSSQKANGARPQGRNGQNGLSGNDQNHTNGHEAKRDEPVPAQLLNITGMETRTGWTTFINVQVNGITAKLFGNKKELAKHITDAGFANIADRITQGMLLNVPCRVITKRSQDGKYLNIEKVLPAKPLVDNGRAG